MERKDSFIKEYFATIAQTFTGTILGSSLGGWLTARVDASIDGGIFPEEWGEPLTGFFFVGGGLAFSTIAQLFILAVVIAFLVTVFYSDRFFKKSMLLWRYAIMMALCVVVLCACVFIFGWFPTNVWQAWVSMIVVFVVAFSTCLIPMIVKTRKEDKKLEKQLSEYKSKRADEQQ